MTPSVTARPNPPVTVGPNPPVMVGPSPPVMVGPNPPVMVGPNPPVMVGLGPTTHALRALNRADPRTLHTHRTTTTSRHPTPIARRTQGGLP
jgi:hypothetical protein